jgi:FlaA1/EpsC-like NDP-sugar epimerase
MIRFFMTIQEAVQLVIQAGALGEKGEIFILDMGEQVPIVELARNMIKLSGYEPEKDIPIEFIGVRPGEKLCEKLAWDYEDKLPTEHEKIVVVRNTGLDKAKLLRDLEELEHAARDINIDRMKEILARMCTDHLRYQLP